MYIVTLTINVTVTIILTITIIVTVTVFVTTILAIVETGNIFEFFVIFNAILGNCN